MRSRARAIGMATAAWTLTAVLVAAGCGGAADAPTASRADASAAVRVFAAASLTEVLPAITPTAIHSFAGSDRLAFQIEQGAPADVFASASPRYLDRLYARGLVERPQAFARNALVVIVPAGNPAGIRTVRDLARPGVRLVVGGPTVPVGEYTRTVLGRLGLASALRNVVSDESDVRGVVTKVALGEADAGIAYRTDLRAEAARVRAIPIPQAAQPIVTYTVAVTRSAANPGAARAYVRRLRGPDGQRILRAFGFLPGG